VTVLHGPNTEICDLVTSQIKSHKLKSNPNHITCLKINLLYSNQMTKYDSIMIKIKSWFGFAHHWLQSIKASDNVVENYTIRTRYGGSGRRDVREEVGFRSAICSVHDSQLHQLYFLQVIFAFRLITHISPFIFWTPVRPS